MPENDTLILKTLFEIKEEQGKIHATVRAVENRVAVQNGRLGTVEGKVQKFEVSYGKIGIILGAANFVLVAGFSLMIDRIKKVLGL